MKILISVVALVLFSNYAGVCARRRSTTVAPPEEVPEVNLEQTLADREASLLDREAAFRKREAVFRDREEKLSQREHAFMEREVKISKREKNIALREQNTLSNNKGKCSANEESEVDFTVQRYDKDTGKLADIGDISVCSDNMRFFASPDNETLGSCDCDYHICSRPLLYSEKYKGCFWAWDKGPCENGEWFTLSPSTLRPVCEVNPCPVSPSSGIPSYYFLSNTTCYKAGSKGPCQKPQRLYTIESDNVIPSCRTHSECPAQGVPALQKCLMGNRRYTEGLCGDVVHDDDGGDEEELE